MGTTGWMRFGGRSTALLLLATCLGCGEPPPPPMRNAVMIVVDTMRRDSLDHANTPAIDALVERGQLGELAWSSDTWTGGSVVSLFSGRHVRNHGWIQSFPGKGHASWAPVPRLPEVAMLAEVLEAEGFDTAGYYANGVLSWRLGFERGFGSWKKVGDTDIPGEVAKEVLSWRDDQRYFLYLHFMGPHTPIQPSFQARKRWGLKRSSYEHDRVALARTDAVKRVMAESYRRAYWAAVEDVDQHLSVIMRLLAPHLDETAIVLTSDHGEMLGERELWGHGRHMDESLTRVPFVAVNTAPLPPRFNNAVAADLITRALGIEAEWELEVGKPEPLVSQHKLKLAISTDGSAKGVWDDQRGRYEVYDLSRYPEEASGYAGRKPELQDARSRFEDRVPRGTVGKERVALDPDMVEELRALGYLGGEAQHTVQ